MVENGISVLLPPRPALSAHSSNTTLSPHQIPPKIRLLDNLYSMNDDEIENEDGDEEDDDEEDEEEEEEEQQIGSDFEAETDHISMIQEPREDKMVTSATLEANELLLLDMSTNIRFGSPIDDSNNFDSCFHLLATSYDDSCRPESVVGLSDDMEVHNTSSVYLQDSGI